MKHILFPIALILFYSQCMAPTPKGAIPLTKEVLKGQLDNGLTYLIRKNAKPKKYAEIRLAFKAGSIFEDEKQLGFAHFCEHMCFNGTKHFPKNKLVSYFESIGMDFGADLNAYTSFDETVYMLSIPLKDDQSLDSGLLVLHDWSCAVNDTDEEIDKERGVIMEEWRLSKGAQERMRQKYFPILLQGSRYAVRLPIGKKEIIEEGSAEDLRRFRREWYYRPELQAIVVVGDIEPMQVKAKIEKLFSAIPKSSSDAPKWKQHSLPDNDKPLVAIVTDVEMPRTMIEIMFKRPGLTMKSYATYEETIKLNLITSMLNMRYKELSRKADPPFVFAHSNTGDFIADKDVYSLSCQTKSGEAIKGIESLLLENRRVSLHGFTQSELKRAKKQIVEFYRLSFANKDKMESAALVDELVRHFLQDEAVPGIEEELRIVENFCKRITLSEINKVAKTLSHEDGKNTLVLVLGPEKENVSLPTEEEVLQAFYQSNKTTPEPYEENLKTDDLLPQKPQAGEIVEERELKEFGATLWKLSNGATVIHKTTTIKNDEILFRAVSFGGYSLYGDDKFLSAHKATSLAHLSGIASISDIDYQKLKAEKKFHVNTSISKYTEQLSGATRIVDAEDMFKDIYLRFTAPRFEDEAFQSYLSKQRTAIENRHTDPMSHFSDTIQAVLGKYRYSAMPMTLERLNQINLQTAEQVYRDRFAGAGDFVFTFVGTVDKIDLKNLVKTYIASLPTARESEKFVDKGHRLPDKNVLRNINKGKEDRAIEIILFHGDKEKDRRETWKLNILSKLVSANLIEEIREKQSLVYSIDVSPMTHFLPEPMYMLQVVFGCAPKNVDKIRDEAYKVIKKTIANVSEKDLKVAVKQYKEDIEKAREQNDFWLHSITDYYFHNYPFETFTRFDEIIDSFTTEDIRQAAKKYFNFDKTAIFILRPEMP